MDHVGLQSRNMDCKMSLEPPVSQKDEIRISTRIIPLNWVASERVNAFIYMKIVMGSLVVCFTHPLFIFIHHIFEIVSTHI